MTAPRGDFPAAENEIRVFCMLDELRTAHDLIHVGFRELQCIDTANDFYHLPHQLLASGFERLLKCYLCLVYEARHGEFPKPKYLKDLGHSLVDLKVEFVTNCYNTKGIPLLEGDLDFLTNDPHLDRLVHILSAFGKFARYYNLDVVTGGEKLPVNTEDEWKELENDLEDPIPYLQSEDQDGYDRDYYPRVNAKIIAKLEQFARSIAMQFTLGKHGGRLLQMSTILTDFRNLTEFGTTDYRRTIEQLEANWHRRTREEVLQSGHPTAVVRRDRLDGEWPFRADEVIVECRDTIFCVVNIGGYDFGLNGAALSKYNYPDPHRAGVAVIGRSIGPFIELAQELGNAGH